MGTLSCTPVLAVELCLPPSNQTVWNPLGIDIFVGLEIASGLGTKRKDVTPVREDCHPAVGLAAEPRGRILDFGRVEDSVHYPEESCSFVHNHSSVAAEQDSTSSRNCKDEATDMAIHLNIDGDFDSMSMTSSRQKLNGPKAKSPDPTSGPLFPEIESLDVADISAACHLLELSGCSCSTSRSEEISDVISESYSSEYVHYFHSRPTLEELSALAEALCTSPPRQLEDACTSSKDQLETTNLGFWGVYTPQTDMSNDFRKLTLKRSKPNRGSTFRNSDSDEDWEVLDRPPHKRLYKSLRQLQAAL